MARKFKGREVNRLELAEIFGVAKTTVDAWVRRGCPGAPSRGRGRERLFNTHDVSQWLRDEARSEVQEAGPKDETELKLRKLEAETIQAELDLAQARRQVAPIDELERAWAMQSAVIRANIMNVPSRVVSQLIGETDEARFKDVLSAELVQALEAAADADIDLDPEEEEEPDAA